MPMRIITDNTLSGVLHLSDKDNNDNVDAKVAMCGSVIMFSYVDVFVFVLPPPQAPTLHT